MKYVYYVTHFHNVNNGFGMGFKIVYAQKEIDSLDDIEVVQKWIIEDTKIPDLIITNWKLLRVEDGTSTLPILEKPSVRNAVGGKQNMKNHLEVIVEKLRNDLLQRNTHDGYKDGFDIGYNLGQIHAYEEVLKNMEASQDKSNVHLTTNQDVHSKE